MSEYICKEDLIKRLEQRFCKPCKEQKLDAGGIVCRACNVADALDEINDFIPADVEPVVHARWIKQNGYTECSNCAYWYHSDETEESDDRSIGCPNCRAKMDKE